MKNKVFYSFRLEIILYALASFLLALATVAVIALGTVLIVSELEEEQAEQIVAEMEEEFANSFGGSYGGAINAAPDAGNGEVTAAKGEPMPGPELAGPEGDEGMAGKEPAPPEIPRGIYYREPKPFVNGWLVGAVFLTLALFILYFFLLTEQFARYLNEITDGIQEISAGNFEVEFSVRRDDELGMIARGLNKMTGDIKLMMENERNTEYAKNELITSVAHDLRTPLTSIIGYLGLVAGREDMDGETKRKYISVAYDKSKRLERLIEDLFSYTKVSFGQITLRKSMVDMVKLTEQLLDEFYPSIQQAELVSSFTANEKQMLVEVDGDLMARAIANLLSNAIKYGRDGKVLRVELKHQAGKIRLMVTNFGQMIPAEDLAHIFDKFYRVETSRSLDTGGTGLGLAITRNIVRMHGGSVEVKSDYGGTVFTVTLQGSEENKEGSDG